MSLHGDVRSALRQQLKTLSGLPSVEWEDRPFEPVVGTSYFREKLIPGNSGLKSIGPNGRIQHDGVWLLDVFVPSGKGSKEADDYAEAIMLAFAPGRELVYNGQLVRIRQAYRSSGRPEADWYQVPVTVVWWADTVNLI